MRSVTGLRVEVAAGVVREHVLRVMNHVHVQVVRLQVLERAMHLRARSEGRQVLVQEEEVRGGAWRGAEAGAMHGVEGAPRRAPPLPPSRCVRSACS